MCLQNKCNKLDSGKGEPHRIRQKIAFVSLASIDQVNLLMKPSPTSVQPKVYLEICPGQTPRTVSLLQSSMQP